MGGEDPAQERKQREEEDPRAAAGTTQARVAAWRGQPAKPPAIHLMTIDSSKGLEYDTVFLTGCEESVLPLEGAAIDEERRLM